MRSRKPRNVWRSLLRLSSLFLGLSFPLPGLSFILLGSLSPLSRACAQTPNTPPQPSSAFPPASSPASPPPWHFEILAADNPERPSADREQSYNRALEIAKSSPQKDRYPEQTILLSRGIFYFSQERFDLSEADFRKALAIAEESLTLIWTESLPAAERRNYLPAYGSPEEERKGKKQSLANLHQWLSQALYRRKEFQKAEEEIEKTLKILSEEKLEAGELRVRTYVVKAMVLEALGKKEEAQALIREADRLRKELRQRLRNN